MAWAIVTDAGTPYFRCAATAPGAISPMKACCAFAPAAGVTGGDGSWLRAGVARRAALPDRRCAMMGRPGMTAVSAVAEPGPADGPGTSAHSPLAIAPLPVRLPAAAD